MTDPHGDLRKGMHDHLDRMAVMASEVADLQDAVAALVERDERLAALEEDFSNYKKWVAARLVCREFRN